MKFMDMVVLINRADSVLGIACAEHFSSEGGLLVLVGQNKKELDRLLEKSKVLSIQNIPHIILSNFVVDSERIVSETIEKFKRLDILINGSGIGLVGSIIELNMDDFDLIMLSNLRGVIEMTKYAIPHLIESRGTIINVSSICSARPFEGFLAYCVSKAALDQFTRCVAIELEGKVRCNSINPGFNIDDFVPSTPNERVGDEHIVPDRESEPVITQIKHIENCVKGIVYLCTNHKESYVSGAILPVAYDGVVNMVTV